MILMVLHDMIAGICNEEGNIMGMMPHPERASEITMAPYESMDSIDGLTYLSH